MVLFVRNSKNDNLVDCEIFNSDGVVKIKSTVTKAKHGLDLDGYNDKVKTLNGVSAIDDAINEVTKTIRKELAKAIKDKPDLSIVED